MAEIIKAFFGDGSKWGITIDYTLEYKPLSTMGPLTLVNDLPEDFLVMNGDVLTDLSYRDFFAKHLSNRSIFTIGAHRRSEKIDYGLLHQNEHGDLIHFEEKPSYDFLVSMGIYMVNREVVNYIPKDTFFGFDHLMYRLIEIGKLPKIYEYKGSWLDIGRPADYEIANHLIESASLV
jgi:NDP-sugar pyrophosphorylase family protein